MTTDKTIRLVVEGIPDAVERMLRVKAAKAGHNSLADYLRKRFIEEFEAWRNPKSETTNNQKEGR